mgnify:CR=1 FL=1
MMDFKSEHFKLTELSERLLIRLERYQKAYDILSEHFDLLPDDVKESVDQALKEEEL